MWYYDAGMLYFVIGVIPDICGLPVVLNAGIDRAEAPDPADFLGEPAFIKSNIRVIKKDALVMGLFIPGVPGVVML